MSVNQILKELDSLSTNQKVEVYNYLMSHLTKKELTLAILDSIKGAGKGVWDMDAQEYVNQLRENDRF